MINIIALGYNWTFERFLEESKGKKDFRILHVSLPKNREERLQATIDICERLGIRWSIPENEATLLEEIKKINNVSKIDVGVVAAYMMFIHEEVLAIPKYGFINLHPSLLPKHRGANPINWAILQGDKCTGCTVHYMAKEIDKGNIILQKKILIGNHDISFISKKLAEIGSSIMWKALELFKNDNPPKGTTQDESKATIDPARSPEDGEIKKEFSALQAIRLIRALNKPWPGAFVWNKGKKFIIYEGRLVSQHNAGRKSVLAKMRLKWRKNTPFLILKDGEIRITKWEECPESITERLKKKQNF